MAFFEFNNIKISAIASAVPTERVEVCSFFDQFGKENVDKFSDMTGVREYRKAKEYQTASDLGYVATEKIFKEKGIDRKEIGALVFASHSPDYRKPATACVLHKRLGLSKECAAFDIGLGCSAFVYGIQVVCSMMSNSDIDKTILIVGETLTKMVYPEDKSSAMMFGDAGSAILFEKTKQNSIIRGLLRTDGEGYKSIIIPAGGARNMHPTLEALTWKDGNKRTLYNNYMNGMNVFSFSISDVPRAIKDFWKKTGTSKDDYDCFIMHQANLYILKQILKLLKLPEEKMPICIDRYGNTAAAALPLTLCDAYGKEENIQSVHTLLCGFGIGLSWGVVDVELNTSDIYEIIETDNYFDEGIINSPEDLYKGEV